VFEAKINGIRWHSTPPLNTPFSKHIVFASVPALSCSLSVVNGRAKVNSGVRVQLPSLVKGDNDASLCIASTIPDGEYSFSFVQSSIFTDVTPIDNRDQIQQIISINITNMMDTAKTFSAVGDTTLTADIVTSAAALIQPQQSHTFTITRTPLGTLYWGTMNDSAQLVVSYD